MLRVGLTGGIASGKSAVAALLAERGAKIIDADVLAREVVASGTPGLAAVIDEFGPEVAGPDGELDRRAVARLVFSDAEARRRLELIIHPLVRARAAELTAEVTAADPDAVVVQVIPLLVETGQAQAFDVLVVVDADPSVQRHRLVTTRGLTEAEADLRIAAQATGSERLAVADEVIENSRSLAALETEVDQLWERLRTRARSTSSALINLD